MTAVAESASSQQDEPRERRALVLPGFLQSGALPCFTELSVQMRDALGIATDVQDMVTGKLTPTESPTEFLCNYSPADWLRDVVEFTDEEHREADYISFGFCRGGNLALGLGAFHSEAGTIFRGSGPIVAIAPSVKFMNGIDPWDSARDKGWNIMLALAHRYPKFGFDHERNIWRSFNFPDSEITYHATMRVLNGWCEPYNFLRWPRDLRVEHDFNHGTGAAESHAYTRNLGDWAPFVKQDVLLIFGDRDTVAPPETGEPLLNMLGTTSADMIVVPGADHDAFWNNRKTYEQVFDAAVGWLGQHLVR